MWLLAEKIGFLFIIVHLSSEAIVNEIGGGDERPQMLQPRVQVHLRVEARVVCRHAVLDISILIFFVVVVVVSEYIYIILMHHFRILNIYINYIFKENL